MRKGIRNKFISEVGASLAVALLLFLVCAVVGSVVLAGASASAGRLSQRRQLQQERYALQSAAGLIREQLAGGTEGGAGSETAAGSGSGQAAGSADADAVNIQYAADLLYNTETGTAFLSSADTSTGSAGSLTIDGTTVSGTANNRFAVLLLQMENQICQKLWQTDGALKGSWPKVEDESEKGTDAKDLGTYVSQSNVRSWTYQPAGGSQNASLPSGNGFVSGDLTIAVGQTDGSTADQAFAVKAEIQADENSNLTIRLSVDPSTAGKYASGQTLIMTLSAQPAGIQYNKQRSADAGSSSTEMNVHFSVSWDTLSIRYQAVGASS